VGGGAFPRPPLSRVGILIEESFGIVVRRFAVMLHRVRDVAAGTPIARYGNCTQRPS